MEVKVHHSLQSIRNELQLIQRSVTLPSSFSRCSVVIEATQQKLKLGDSFEINLNNILKNIKNSDGQSVCYLPDSFKKEKEKKKKGGEFLGRNLNKKKKKKKKDPQKMMMVSQCVI